MSRKVKVTKEVKSFEDAEGNITTNTLEKTSQIQDLGEPDYIKIYTNMWCEFNQIPTTYRELFLLLAFYMTYANASTIDSPDAGGQIVFTNAIVRESICKNLKWKDSMFYRGIRALLNCHAIRKIGRSVYQINPSYAGKGYWKYKSSQHQGGIENIQAFFDFAEGTVDAKIYWGSDEFTSAEDCKNYGVAYGEDANLSSTTIKGVNGKPQTPQKPTSEEVQITLNDIDGSSTEENSSTSSTEENLQDGTLPF